MATWSAHPTNLKAEDQRLNLALSHIISLFRWRCDPNGPLALNVVRNTSRLGNTTDSRKLMAEFLVLGAVCDRGPLIRSAPNASTSVHLAPRPLPTHPRASRSTSVTCCLQHPPQSHCCTARLPLSLSSSYLVRLNLIRHVIQAMYVKNQSS